MKNRYNYAETMMMKMFLARRDYAHGCSEAFINFEYALIMKVN